MIVVALEPHQDRRTFLRLVVDEVFSHSVAGPGNVHYDPSQIMTHDLADSLIEERGNGKLELHVDYVSGRPCKISLDPTEADDFTWDDPEYYASYHGEMSDTVSKMLERVQQRMAEGRTTLPTEQIQPELMNGEVRALFCEEHYAKKVGVGFPSNLPGTTLMTFPFANTIAARMNPLFKHVPITYVKSREQFRAKAKELGIPDDTARQVEYQLTFFTMGNRSTPLPNRVSLSDLLNER